MDSGEPCDQCGAVAGLELVEPRPVHQPRNDLAHVVLPAQVGADDAADFVRVVPRVFGRRAVDRRRRGGGQRRDHGAGDLERIEVVLGQVVGHAGQPRVDVGAAELLG